MWKKIAGLIVCMLLIGTIGFSMTISSSEPPVVSVDEECPCLYGTLIDDEPEITGDVYDTTLRNLPLSWDWRNIDGNDWTTPIRDQDQDKCGSCWAFGALSGMESCVKIWSNNSDLNVDLSEQYPLSCSPGSCHGWYLDRMVKWIKTNGSIPESCFLYQADDTIPCDAKCAEWRESLIGIDGYQKVTANISVIKSALVTYGPLPATMDVYGDFYPNFTGGVYHHTSGAYVFGHCIAIVGYDDTGEEGYWICKNSWGTGWGGEGGWFRIAYGECKIEKGVYALTGPNYALVKPDAPTGESIGKVGNNYTYSALAADPDGDTIRYCFDFGAGVSLWSGYVASGEPVSMNYTWDVKGNYEVCVKTQDEHGLESGWSDPLPVRMPRDSSILHKNFFDRLFERFPWLLSFFSGRLI
jgi:C1A family cysteine protease